MIFYESLNKYMFVCLFALAIVVQAGALGEPELINLNPGFEEVPNFNDWDQYINAEAGATFDINKDAFEGKQCAHINVNKISGTNWHVGLTQDGLTLEAGQLYTADFFAKADAKRIINLEFKRSPGQGDWEGITAQDITITEEWAEYFINFTPGKEYKQTAFLGFWLGQVKGEVWIDSVRLYEGKKQERQETVPPKSVDSRGKQITTWATMRVGH